MFNKMKEEISFPEFMNFVNIIFIYKGKGSKMELKNDRGTVSQVKRFQVCRKRLRLQKLFLEAIASLEVTSSLTHSVSQSGFFKSASPAYLASSSLVKSGQVRSSPVKSRQVSSGPVRSSQVLSSPFKFSQVQSSLAK